MKQSDDYITLFIDETNKGIMIMGMLGSSAAKIVRFNMGAFINEITSHFGGKGGGSNDYGQGVISDKTIKVQMVLDLVQDKLIRKESKHKK